MMFNVVSTFDHFFVEYMVFVKEQLHGLSRIDCPITPSIGNVMGGPQFALRVDKPITTVNYAVWSFVFVVELPVLPNFVSIDVSH